MNLNPGPRNSLISTTSPVFKLFVAQMYRSHIHFLTIMNLNSCPIFVTNTAETLNI